MSKTKKKLTKEEKLAKDRLRKKEKYEMIKNDPQLYAIQKEKERKRYLIRKQQMKITSIKNMTPRAQRDQRKRWRKNSRQYLKNKEEKNRFERVTIENSAPDSEIGNSLGINNQNVSIQDPLEKESARSSPQNTQPSLIKKGIMRKMQYKYQKTIKDLKNEIERLKRENYKMKRQCPIDNIVNDSIQKKVNEIVKDIKGERVEEVKKKLIFGETVSSTLKKNYTNLSKKDKRIFAETFIKDDKKRFKKYGVLKKLPFSLRSKTVTRDSVSKEISDKITNFFEEDSNTRMASGKKEFITRNGIKKQKRYLNDSMKNLHLKFIAEKCNISYSTFCKYRPFWVSSPSSRDTCLCKLHSNMELLVSALKRANVINEISTSEVIKNICCNASNEQCLDRSCPNCTNKLLKYKEFRNDKIYYYEWVAEKKSYQSKSGSKEANITTKKKQYDFIRNIILKLENMLPKFMKHIGNIVMQFEAIKQLKFNLKEDEILIHVDFSENYSLKYNEEIQSFHFGGSRGQVSLHTGVIYYYDALKNCVEVKSFCTISQCLNHDAAAVWAHLKPILNIAKDLVKIRAIHFLSDSPTSQYRNKYIFYILSKLKEQLTDVEYITWNYQEAGHGKGAPDGIGAVIKRTADNFVKNGGDVGSFEAFLDVITHNVKNVIIDVIPEDQITRVKFPENIPTFKGTMNVHQVIWATSLPFSVALRSRSCFICKDSYVPCSHGKHLGVLSIGIKSSSTTCLSCVPVEETKRRDVTDFKTYNSDVAALNNLAQSNKTISDLNIDSPTICNNINISNVTDDILLNEIDDNLFLNDTVNDTCVTGTQDTPKVQILSNVPFNWQSYTFYKNQTKSFNPNDQQEFEKFISDINITNMESINDNKSTENEIDHIDITNIKKEFGTKSKKEKNKENHIIYNIGDWVAVQYQIKSKIYAYIGKIREIDEDSYTILFLRKGKLNKFSWPIVDDEDVVSKSRILCSLASPEIDRRGQFIFNNLPNLCFK